MRVKLFLLLALSTNAYATLNADRVESDCWNQLKSVKSQTVIDLIIKECNADDEATMAKEKLEREKIKLNKSCPEGAVCAVVPKGSENFLRDLSQPLF
ncbi:MAG: hypothetical protein ABL933_15765 [Methyloglobulus sp.]